jgi:hypothetical protein
MIILVYKAQKIDIFTTLKSVKRRDKLLLELTKDFVLLAVWHGRVLVSTDMEDKLLIVYADKYHYG